MGISVITFAVCGKNRDWMPRWQQNWYGWSFIVAVVTCILETIIGNIQNIFKFHNQFMNIFDVKLYSYNGCGTKNCAFLFCL